LESRQSTTGFARSDFFSEQQLEDVIVTAPEILSGEWMRIGRQEQIG